MNFEKQMKKRGLKTLNSLVPNPYKKASLPLWARIAIPVGSAVAAIGLVVGIVVPVVQHSFIPVYEGMTISQESTPVLNKKNKEGDNGNHYGHKNHDEEIEEDITTLVEIDVETDDTVKYYVKPGETFVIEVHISNPRQFEIQSFTLNGQKYANYMFEDGSNMELLLLKTTAPTEPGYYDYTIDAIKYIDGTAIKDVDMSKAEKSIKVGVTYTSSLPKATVTRVERGTYYLEFDINVSNVNEHTDLDSLEAYLTDGEKVIGVKKLIPDNNTVKFEQLEMCKAYQLGVNGVYDAVDGQGARSEWMFKESFETKAAFEIVDIDADKTSITFGINEVLEGATITDINLYDATTKEIAVDGDASTRLFDGLLSDHEYSIFLDFAYGTEVNDWVSAENIKTDAKVAPILTFDSSSSDKTSITYSVSFDDVDGILNVTKVELLKDGEVVKDNGTLLNGTFSNLLSDNSYSVKVSYTYDLNDGQGIRSDSITKDVTTVAKVAPALTFDSSSSDKTSITYSVSFDDVDGILNVTKVELLKDGEVVKDNGTLLNGTFSDLLSNNLYSVKVTYTYDLNDGQGVLSNSIIKDITTLVKVVPTIVVSNDEVTDTTIKANISMTDEDSVGFIESVELYEGDSLVTANSNNEIDFSNLKYYTEYNVVIAYKYDLNDGNGVIQNTFTKSYKTQPHVELTSTNILNPGEIAIGETIYLQSQMESSDTIKVKKAVINGEEIACSGTTKSKISFEIVNNGQFDGGNTTFTIEKIIYEIDGNEYEIIINENNSASAFILGRLKFVSLTFINELHEQIEYGFGNEKTYGLINLENKTGYSVTSVINGTGPEIPLSKINDSEYIFEITETGWHDYNFTKLLYGENGENNVPVNMSETKFLILESDEKVEIKNKEDLLNMNENKYYELQNDIDLSGMNWVGNSFNGIFDGKNHSIKNMTNINDLAAEGTSYCNGLFSRGTGFILNLIIENMNMFYSLEPTSSTISSGYSIGAIVGFGSRETLVLKNCSVDEDSSISVSVKNQSDPYFQYLGGLVGQGCTFYNCTNSGSVKGTNYVAGLSNDGYYYGCVNNGPIVSFGNYNASASPTIAGIGGSGYFEDCVNNGDVSAPDKQSSFMLGAVGGVAGTATTMINCANYGNVTVTATGQTIYGGFGGVAGSANTMINCTNYGKVITPSNVSRAGGVVGFLEKLCKNCKNYGELVGGTKDIYGDKNNYAVIEDE